MISLALASIVKNDIETAGSRDDELMARFQCMACAPRATGDIVEIKNPLDLKRYVPFAFDESQIAPRVRNPRQFDIAAIAHRNDIFARLF